MSYRYPHALSRAGSCGGVQEEFEAFRSVRAYLAGVTCRMASVTRVVVQSCIRIRVPALQYSSSGNAPLSIAA